MFYTTVRGINKQVCHLQKYICNPQNATNVQQRHKSILQKYREYWSPKVVIPPYQHVTQIGDPVLRGVAQKVPIADVRSNEIQTVIKAMKRVMKRYDSMGLAAPQIGVSLRIFAIELNAKTNDEFSAEVRKVKEMETVPFTLFINPEMKILNYEKVVFTEACESIRGYCADVPRYKEVTVSGYNANGEPINMNAKGWTARLIQHEMDHLNGRFYTDIMDKNTLACGCWEAVNKHAGRIEIRYIP